MSVVSVCVLNEALAVLDTYQIAFEMLNVTVIRV